MVFTDTVNALPWLPFLDPLYEPLAHRKYANINENKCLIKVCVILRVDNQIFTQLKCYMKEHSG